MDATKLPPKDWDSFKKLHGNYNTGIDHIINVAQGLRALKTREDILKFKIAELRDDGDPYGIRGGGRDGNRYHGYGIYTLYSQITEMSGSINLSEEELVQVLELEEL